MNKIILIILIVVILVVAGGFMYYKGNFSFKTGTKQGSVNSAGDVTTKMPETNPFKTNVNPMDGYTNPFAK